MFQTTIKLNKDLANRVKTCAEKSGYSSVQEFVEHLLNKELSQLEEAESNESLVKKMQGLGYID
jgi:metal-responsive CopG/Arc/MetJ family transcriptional regulator